MGSDGEFGVKILGEGLQQVLHRLIPLRVAPVLQTECFLKMGTAATATRCVSIIVNPACPLQVWICVPNGGGGPALGASLFRWRRSQRGYH